jgi:hypothetical protein
MRTTAERGYGKAHRNLRAQWAPLVERGEVRCARCHRFIKPGTPWDLDHGDDRSTYRGPSHRACNRATATHMANRRNARALRGGPASSREW